MDIDKLGDGDRSDGDLSRREFVRGAAATGLAVIGASYAKPTLKLAGVTRLASATSNPPRRTPREDHSEGGDNKDAKDGKDNRGD